MIAAAVILSKSAVKTLAKAGLKDSKALSEKKRKSFVPLIKELSEDWALGQSSALEIDVIGIRSATEISMIRALQKLHSPLRTILVDGVLPIRGWIGEQRTIIKGDTKIASIAAASILAKDFRDNLIRRISYRFPEYGLEKNVGYGTKLHREVLKNIGPCRMHRKTFLSRILIT